MDHQHTPLFQVDYNKNGVIEAIEVEVAILHLYNLVNKRLPGWQDPPSRQEIINALRAYDEDGNGTLDEKEFEELAKSLMRTGPDAFFARVGKSAVVNTAFLPAAAVAVQKLTPNSAVRVVLGVFLWLQGSNMVAGGQHTAALSGANHRLNCRCCAWPGTLLEIV